MDVICPPSNVRIEPRIRSGSNAHRLKPLDRHHVQKSLKRSAETAHALILNEGKSSADVLLIVLLRTE